MGPRYPPGGPRPGVRLPQMGSDFNGVSPFDLSIFKCSIRLMDAFTS